MSSRGAPRILGAEWEHDAQPRSEDEESLMSDYEPSLEEHRRQSARNALYRAERALEDAEAEIRRRTRELEALRARLGPLRERLRERQAVIAELDGEDGGFICPECEQERRGEAFYGNQEAHTCIQREMERAQDSL